VKNEGSTAAASNPLADDGQAATCPKCCVIKDFLKCSKNNMRSQANLDTHFLYLYLFNVFTQEATQAEARLLQGAKEKYLQVLLRLIQGSKEK
jgi:hypothetical protein